MVVETRDLVTSVPLVVDLSEGKEVRGCVVRVHPDPKVPGTYGETIPIYPTGGIPK